MHTSGAVVHRAATLKRVAARACQGNLAEFKRRGLTATNASGSSKAPAPLLTVQCPQAASPALTEGPCPGSPGLRSAGRRGRESSRSQHSHNRPVDSPPPEHSHDMAIRQTTHFMCHNRSGYRSLWTKFDASGVRSAAKRGSEAQDSRDVRAWRATPCTDRAPA